MIFSRKSSTWGVCYLAGGLVVTAPVSFCLKPRNEGFDGSCQSSMRNFFHSSQYYFIYLKRSDRGPKGRGSETFLFFRHLLLFFLLFIRGIFLRGIFFEGIFFLDRSVIQNLLSALPTVNFHALSGLRLLLKLP